MEQLPIEIQEIILNNFLWDKIGELYHLRVVSKGWKCMIDEFTSRLFTFWYNRCKNEIPEENLQEIVQTKYPLVAQPWRECYWVDRGLPDVAKNVYEIWTNFSNLNDGIDKTKLNIEYPFKSLWDPIVCINDKYLAVSCYHEDEEQMGTRIFRWDNLKSHIRRYKFMSDQLDFYSTRRGTFLLLGCYDKTKKDWEIHISKYPINNLDLPSESILLERGIKKYCITQNECFYINATDDYTNSRIVEHKILTESGFETTTIIEPPAEMPRYEWDEFRVEICGCTLYVMQSSGLELSIAQYKISRNSDEKLSFTFEELKILNHDDEGYNGALFSQIFYHIHVYISSENLSLTDLAFASAKFNPWLSRVSRKRMHVKAVYANYVFCAEDRDNTSPQICIFQKKDLIECMNADGNPDHLKRAFFNNIKAYVRPCFGQSTIKWIGIIYIGLKARIVVQLDYFNLCLVNFY